MAGKRKRKKKVPRKKPVLLRLGFLLIGLLLVPVCGIVTASVARLLGVIPFASGPEITRGGWAFAIGFVLWVSLYVTMPRPVRTYVLAHELTHALWGALMGAEVSRMKLSREGGSVSVSKNNLFITLAPYFFPLYTVIVIGVYCLLSVFVDLSGYDLFWLALVGFTWSFHVTFTISTLLEHQSDIREYGPVLSYSVIYLLNLVGVGLWIVAVSEPTLEEFTRYAANDGRIALRFVKNIGTSLQ